MHGNFVFAPCVNRVSPFSMKCCCAVHMTQNSFREKVLLGCPDFSMSARDSTPLTGTSSRCADDGLRLADAAWLPHLQHRYCTSRQLSRGSLIQPGRNFYLKDSCAVNALRIFGNAKALPASRISHYWSFLSILPVTKLKENSV